MTLNQALISSTTLSTSASSVTISVPSGYTDLRLVISARGAVSAGVDDLLMRFNGDSSSAYIGRYLTGNGSSAASGTNGYGNFAIGYPIPANTATANTYSNVELYVPDYTSNKAKSFHVDIAGETNGTTAYMSVNTGQWSGTSAITSIYLQVASGNLMAGSSFTLYGISKLGVTPTQTPKATGGDIIKNDGTYWYHAFLSTGAFIPQTTLSADVLVVAGGGGGGSWNGGGGGAGGLLTFASQSISGSSTVTVGAGGAGSNPGGSRFTGYNGTNSVFGSLSTTYGGGGGGGGASQAPLTGGSGGGAGTMTYQSGAAGTAGQGYAGGSSTGSPNYACGGGGGAGGVGSDGNANGSGGIGGIGATYTLQSFIDAMGSATNTGQLSSTHYYYAGGGGGGSEAGGGSASGGLGGGGTGTNSGNPTDGSANTGGGGGGRGAGNSTNAGANGGSGIVIVRYAMA